MRLLRQRNSLVSDIVLTGGDPNDINAVVLPKVYRDCTLMMEDKELIKTLQDLDFDLVVVDGFILCPCNLILPEYLGIPYVAVSAVFPPLSLSIPAFPHFYPSQLTEFSDKMILMEKLVNTFMTYMMMNLPFKEAHDVSLLREYNIQGQWIDLLRKAELFIFSRNHLME